jgi:integrase
LDWKKWTASGNQKGWALMVCGSDEKRYLTSDEVQVLLNTIINPEHLIIVRLLLNGLRVSEVVGLIYYNRSRSRRYGKVRYDGIWVKHIDLKECFIRITGKGMKKRVVVIDKRTMYLLKNYIQLKNIKSGKVFKMTPRNVEDFLKRWGDKAGLPHVHPHKLRHTWSVKALRSKVADKNVSDQLGHKTPQFTAMFYGKIAPDDRRDDIEKQIEEW